APQLYAAKPAVQQTVPVSPAGPRPPAPQVNTSINPNDIYTPRMARAAANHAYAQAFQRANPVALMKQYDRPAVSRSAGTMSAILPEMSALLSNAREMATLIPFQDAAANAQHRLQGQIARESEGQSLMETQLARQRMFDEAEFGRQQQLLQ